MLTPDNEIRSPWMYETQPFEIVPGLYYVGNKAVSAHLFDTGEGLLLLDSTYQQTTYHLLESIRELGFRPNDIKWILHTHGHIDHFGGTRILQEKYNCKTYFPAVDMPLLSDRADLNWCADLGQPFTPPYDTWFEVDHQVHNDEVLQFGNITVEAVAAPGHTPGTMAYFFDLPCGYRAAMHGGIGWNTLESQYIQAHNLDGSWRLDYLNSLAKLRGIPVDIVLGNHPEQTRTYEKQAKITVEHNPFIDPDEWDGMLNELDIGVREFYAKDPL